MSLMKAQTLKGFRDYLPPAALAREQLLETARQVYRSYGFSPIDTPALEYTEILLGKGGEETDKQLFRFTDQGDRDVAMRFDLTIPFARFTAQHLNDLGLPFKRYHLGTVWRGEKPQRGRYREFMQCDFDTIGTESNAADCETLLVIHDLLAKIGFERFQVHVNNRLVLNGLLDKIGLSGQTSGVLRSLDKLHKIGPEGVSQELTEKVGTSAEQAQQVLALAHIGGDNAAILSQLESLLRGNELGELGIARLRELCHVAQAAGIPQERVALDVSIARGLDYYTGTVYETILTDDPSIGSVCSGGRYDNLAGLFTSQKLPGVGASLGLDRLLAALENLGKVAPVATPAQVLVVLFQANRLGDYLRIGRVLRAAGINTEVFPAERPVGKQLKYADAKGFSLAVIAGDDEFAVGKWRVKNLKKGIHSDVDEVDLVAHIKTEIES